MQPTLRDGNIVLGWKWFRPRPGQIVVVTTPARMVIKRITRIDRSQVWIEGDNAAASTDSRQHGAYRLADVQARVLIKK